MYYRPRTADIIACEQPEKGCCGSQTDRRCVCTHQMTAIFCPKYHVDMKTFGLSCEDVQDNWRLRIKAATG